MAFSVCLFNAIFPYPQMDSGFQKTSLWHICLVLVIQSLILEGDITLYNEFLSAGTTFWCSNPNISPPAPHNKPLFLCWDYQGIMGESDAQISLKYNLPYSPLKISAIASRRSVITSLSDKVWDFEPEQNSKNSDAEP